MLKNLFKPLCHTFFDTILPFVYNVIIIAVFDTAKNYNWFVKFRNVLTSCQSVLVNVFTIMYFAQGRKAREKRGI